MRDQPTWAFSRFKVAVWAALALMGVTAWAQSEMAPADLVANIADWTGKQAVVRGRIKSAIADADKTIIVLMFEGNLRCRIRRSDIEKIYRDMQVSCVQSGNTLSIRLTHPKLKEVKQAIFNVGEELVVGGQVAQKGANWVYLDNVRIVTYAWPEVGGYYFDEMDHFHTYGNTRNNYYSSNGMAPQPNNDAGVTDNDTERVAAADLMANAEKYHGKKVRVQGTIQRVDPDDSKENIQVVMDGNLRCRVRKADAEKHYPTSGHQADYISRTPWSLALGPKGSARAARLSCSETVRWNNQTARYHVDLFNSGDKIEIVGTVNRKSLNRVTLDGTTVVTYEWPQNPVHD